MSEQNREHLAFVAVMNALDVHMPPDGAALLTELRAIAATVGYPWRGTPLTAGPVAPPPEDWADDAKWLRLYNLVSSLAHPKGDHRENALEDEAHDIIRELSRNLIRPALGEAQRGAARPPQPDLHAECHDLVCNGSRDKPRGEGNGCSCRTRAEREFEELLALRAVVESAARPPASQPALEASVRELVENYTKSGGCGWCGGLPHSSGCLVGRMERALAVPPEAPPP